MSHTAATRHRQGFTLVELLVVISVMAVVAVLGYMFFPSFSNRTMVDAADRLQGWLLSAKQQAKRDNRPGGLRLLIANGTYVTTMQYVQAPDDFMGPYNTAAATNAGSTCTCAASTNVTFTFPAGGSLLGTATRVQATGDEDLALVQKGDYIEFDRGGAVYPIAGITNAAGTAITLSLAPPQSYTAVPYRIIRQPRRILGEEDLILPGNTAEQASINANTGTVVDASKCLNLPTARPVYDTGAAVTCYEILFGPSGSVVGPAASHDIVSLWLCTQNNLSPPVLVTIRTRTGAISVNPVNQSPGATDAYSFARDGRASGM